MTRPKKPVLQPALRTETWIIGIGASAGGLEALSTLVSNLTPEFSTPIIIAQHLAPRAKSMMVELLQRQSARPVVSAINGEQLQPNTIYVVPPNHDIDIQENHIVLTVAGIETRPKPSIDAFFHSLAKNYGARAVGIVLSGTGSDGSEGIRAIKSAGGITLAQDEQSAKYDGMPNSAVHTGDVDSVLPPDQLARELPRILTEHSIRQNPGPSDTKALRQILDHVRDSQGTDFNHYKKATVQRRLIKRMSVVGVPKYDDYLQLLKDSPAEVAQLAKEMLVSVTNFFRDPDVFHALEPLISRIVSQKENGQEIRVWVAGCATGEEAYSMAMLFLEEIERQRHHLRLKVFATDLDQDAITEARNGFYSSKDCEKVPADLLEKYFERRTDQYEVSQRLRDSVVFARQDLTLNPPFVKLDMVTCRNVLIYFSPELQKRIIEIFHYSLEPGGVLVLGKSESASVLTTLFEVVDRTLKIHRKLNIASKSVPMAAPRGVAPLSKNRIHRPNPGPSVTEQSYLRLLNFYAIAGVTIDQDCNIIQILGDVSPYLGFFTPQADFRLTNLLPKGIGIEIPILLRKAAKDGKTHRSRTYRNPKSKTERFSIMVRPLEDASEDGHRTERQLFVVNFEAKSKKEIATEPEFATTDKEKDQRYHEIEQELFVTREHLQTVIEELGVSNEELQSLNEELSSTNEELQASSEELETTNEELQSSNEELTTLNEELNAKQSELRFLNISFENVQNSIGTPLVILDNAKRVVRYNPEALRVFALSNSDIGREISRVSSNFEVADFAHQLDLAITKGQSSESLAEVGSSIYQMRILPCIDDEKNITGAIIVFYDNTIVLKSQERLKVNDLRMRAIVDGSSGPIFLKDSVGRYILVNQAFCDLFQLTQEQLIGKTDRDLFSDSLASQFREADLDVFVTRLPRERQETVTDGFGRKRYLLIRRFPLMTVDGKSPYALGAVATDVTQQVEAQQELKVSENRYRAIVEDRFVFVARHKPDGTLTYTNVSFVNQFGKTFENSQDSKFEQIVAEVDRPRVSNELMAISKENPLVQYEHRVVGKAAQPIWVRWLHRGIFNESGQIIEYQAVGFDVTESRLKTDHLLERDSIYSQVFDHTVDFLSIYRVDGQEFVLESYNRSAGRAKGRNYTEMIGQNLREFVDPEKLEQVIALYQKTLRSRQTEVFEEQIETPNGTRYFSTTLIPVPGQSGAIERIAAISRDITSQKRIELDLRRAKDEADVANRSKSDFLASMSHELRTPLNVVIGMSQLLGDTQMTSEQQSFVGSIYRSGKVLMTLIEDVLDVSKIEAGKVKLDSISFCPATVIEEVIEFFMMQARDKGIELTAQLASETRHYAIGDPARLRQILVNLVSNALKFTDHGEVTIVAQGSLQRHRNEMILTIAVKDTGIGIDEASHSRLFQRFSQVDSGNSRKYGGTGLGLMITKNLTQMMNGSIDFESKFGKGSTFRVVIPLVLSNHQGPTMNQDHLIDWPQKNARPLKILAVDDSTDSRSVIGLFLQKLGHDTTLAQGGYEALTKIEQDQFDLVLMDIQMPDMDGYEVTAKIRQLPDPKKKIPVIALTANAMAGDAKRAFDSGMDDYITKPIQLTSLKDLLAKWSTRV